MVGTPFRDQRKGGEGNLACHRRRSNVHPGRRISVLSDRGLGWKCFTAITARRSLLLGAAATPSNPGLRATGTSERLRLVPNSPARSLRLAGSISSVKMRRRTRRAAHLERCLSGSRYAPPPTRSFTFSLRRLVPPIPPAHAAAETAPTPPPGAFTATAEEGEAVHEVPTDLQDSLPFVTPGIGLACDHHPRSISETESQQMAASVFGHLLA
jgi:hypothetical protein